MSDEERGIAMSRILFTNRPGFFSRLANVGVMAAIREVRVTAQTEVRGVQSSPDASIIAADRDRRAESLDAVAGSEFFDDRIRLQE